MSIDWNAIHPINGSQANAFEELCAQLARAESPKNARFERKGSPDAGVECFSILPDSSEWGWQAKYFDSLGPSQWSQLDKSVKSALDKHPALVRYYVCAPMDRPDARVSGQKSAMERWDEHVQKWNEWVQDTGRTVEYVWWGSSELVDLLSRQSEHGRLLFWFGEVEFNQAWFGDRLGEAIKAAGPRYTPEVHVELDVVQHLTAFARTKEAFDQTKALARELRTEFQIIVPAASKDDDPLERLDQRQLPRLGKAILEEFAALEFTPVEEIPFVAIAGQIGQAESTTAEVLEELRQLEGVYDAEEKTDAQAYPYRNNPYTNWLHRIYRLQAKLRETRSRLSVADRFFNNRLMILKGGGGTGKTHLLCDFGTKRVTEGAPVVLLLGQWFSQQSEPWTQLLQQLGLQGKSPEQFIGALEAAAQTANSRALVMIDALNEGRGSEIWLSHLASFLARLEKSPWVGVVLSVRSSYEKSVLSAGVEDQAAVVTHQGFAGREYDAVKTFFSFYDLEFPSTPILQPEYRNPLFLKTLCEGLQRKGERRIPHGFHGISAAFDLFLDAINEKLASRTQLDYNENDFLVRRGLETVAKELIETASRSIPRARAQEIVDELLPGRTFSNSLYRGLVSEGVLVEDKAWWTDDPSEEVVLIAYDRFADHIIADFLLQTHLDSSNPAAAFSETGGLAFLCEKEGYAASGLVEALSVQVPELTGQELLRLAPGLWDDARIGAAFLGSIVWRSLEAFSEDTIEVLNELVEAGKIWSGQLETLLTVSTVPGHYCNAELLDTRLRRDTMAERDAWWSIYLHRAWGEEGPVDRLVDWASNVTPDDQIEPAVVDLAAITLAWMLTTSNRFLRDNATKALVSLLTARLESTIRLVERFADVDDPYVTERLYAVAYGVALRSLDVNSCGQLASVVYKLVFASGVPPAHILLRDYARGVIERAIFLGSDVSLDEKLIRPPYNSNWPSIPCEDCVEALTPNEDLGAWDGGDLEWSRNRIRWSVFGDDFSRYVIGDEYSSNWLSIGLEEEPWQSPEERKQTLLLELNESELLAWEEFQRAESEILPLVPPVVIRFLDPEGNTDGGHELRIGPTDEEACRRAQQKLGLLHDQLMANLIEAHRTEFESILHDKNDRDGREGPRFNKEVIKRYIVWRVFDLGWTIERFGYFDRFDIGDSGREAAKPERIGKKYQWIAYHEILAYISDHFQYRDRWGSSRDNYYQGPLQQTLRDIDPSFTLRPKTGSTSWGPHSPIMLGNGVYESWDEGIGHDEWLSRTEDILEIKKFLEVVHPTDGTRWLNVHGFFVWKQPQPADVDPFDVVRRELWFSCIGYFIKKSDFNTFAEWAITADSFYFTNAGALDTFGMFIGEYPWAPAFEYLDRSTDVEEESSRASGWSGFVRPASRSYHAGISGFDCSAGDAMNFLLPNHNFVDRLGLKWNGPGSEYLEENGKVGAFDPTANDDGPTALLLREDLVKQYIADEGLTLCWVVMGEKWVIGGQSNHGFHGALKIQGVYRLTDQGPDGQLRFQIEIPESE